MNGDGWQGLAELGQVGRPEGAAAQGRSIPGEADLMGARRLECGQLVEFALRSAAVLGDGQVVELLRRERWQVWGGLAWPWARADGSFAGAVAVLGERLAGDEPDGLVVLLRFRVYQAIEADGADGLGDALELWRHRLGLARVWYPEGERSGAYAARLRGQPAGRAVVAALVGGFGDDEAEVLLQQRVRRGRLLVPADAAGAVLRGGIREPAPLRRAVWAGLMARERWLWVG